VRVVRKAANVRWTGDVSRGDWIGPRMSGWASRDSVLPGGFPAYARIFHPGVRYWWDGPVNRPGSTRLSERPIAWAEVAALTGTIAHPWMQWGTVARQQTEESDLGDGTSVESPEDGRLPRHILDALLPLLRNATSTPEDVTAAVWNGWGELNSVSFFGWSEDGHSTSGTRSATELGVADEITAAVETGQLLHLPGRDYLLFAGPLDDLADPDWTSTAGLGEGLRDGGVPAPQLLWPADHAWCSATEIDFGFTLLAGPEPLIERLLVTDGIEAARLEHDGDLSWDGDTINPPAADRS
jgi:hypothetical protein